MPERIIASSSGKILDTPVDEAPSHAEALMQGQSRASTEMMLVSQPRSYDR